MSQTEPKQIVVSVSTVVERDKMVKQIYTNLTAEPDKRFTVLKDQVNRIKVFHNVEANIKILIRVYLVIIIPINIDLSPASSLTGNLDFHLDATIKEVNKLLGKLQALQGQHYIKGSTNGQTFGKLVEELRGAYGRD